MIYMDKKDYIYIYIHDIHGQKDSINQLYSHKCSAALTLMLCKNERDEDREKKTTAEGVKKRNTNDIS